MTKNKIPEPIKGQGKKTRKPVGKRTRFEIFKRDGFTCVYCGAQPPDVVLVIDHIHPIAAGGTNDPTNLCSSCEACNAGKSDKQLGNVGPRPDADVLFLEAQQEIAELRRYNEAMAELDMARSEFIVQIQDQWCSITGQDWCPNDHVIRQMLCKYDIQTVESALTDVAMKIAGYYLKKNSWLPYAWAVMRNMEADCGS